MYRIFHALFPFAHSHVECMTPELQLVAETLFGGIRLVHLLGAFVKRLP